MRVLYIVESLDNKYGGPARSVPNIALNIKNSHGVDSVLFSVSKNSDEKNEVIDTSNLLWLKCCLNGPKKLMFSFGMLKALINPNFMRQFDVIHLNNIWNFPALLAWYSSHKFKIPLIISPRGSIYKWSLSQGFFYKKIALIIYQKKMLEQAALIHVTDLSEMHALNDLGINSKHIIIPNGVNRNQGLSETECSNFVLVNNTYSDRRKILFVGRIHKKKGLDLLISAFLELFEIFPMWDLHIVGFIDNNDDYAIYLKKLINNSAGSNRIIFHGELVGLEKNIIYKNSDLFVLPSHSENFGISVAEAMSNGLPVITTNNTPWKELELVNAGWCIDLSKDNLKIALQNALSLDNKILKSKGQNGKYYIKKFDWEILSSQYNDMYSTAASLSFISKEGRIQK